MNWPAIRDTLAAVIAATTSLPLDAITWAGEIPASSAVITTRAVLSTPTVAGIGIDEVRSSVNGLNDVTVNLCGQRRFTWSIQIESQEDTQLAYVLIDNVRTRIRRQSIRDMLNVVGVAIGTELGATQRNVVQNGRQVTWAVMDMNMLAVENDLDTTLGAGQWIGEALIAGTVGDANPDGTAQTVTLDVNSAD